MESLRISEVGSTRPRMSGKEEPNTTIMEISMKKAKLKLSNLFLRIKIDALMSQEE